MTRRRCVSCGGNKIVRGALTANKLFPALCPDAEDHFLVCPTCKGSGFQEGERLDGAWRWRPAPQEYIVL